ncbi:hypothetical protein QYM36_013977 [Artemia franciscana]|uniref:PiggyBac transposable element-derived protein domain-containing protein n=1 Tax=Artemia franciscana TaxID=6661 RepID=A0AA88L530_ARTSF|nr:hypothetical protein QYM36_013977 [Artemia franciscana]
MFIELLDGDVSEMSDLSDSNDEESDSKYLLLNPKLKLTQLELTQDSPPTNDFLGSHDLEEHGPSTSSDRATEDHPTNRCKPKTNPGHDCLFKVRPIVDLLQENLMRTEPEERHSKDTDEQIIPFKGRSVMHQYLRSFMQLYLPNKLHNIDLFVHLKEIGYDCIGTIHQNHLSGCKKSTDVSLVCWYNKKVVMLVSNYIAVEPKDTCRHWDSSEKKYVEIERPAVIKEFNKYMGGVDLADMLIELYHSNTKTIKWYMHIFYCK